MQTVEFKAGETIIAEGEAGETAFLIISGSVEVSIGIAGKAKSIGTLVAGDVFGEMSLIDRGPRSATVKAVTDTQCLVTAYNEFIDAAQADPGRAFEFMKTLVRRLRQMNERMALMSPGTDQQVQRYLQVIIAGLDGQDSLSGAEMEALHRELRMLLQNERLEVAGAEIDKGEQVLGYMLRPGMEECLNLWFGKSQQTDQDIWNRFGADVALASRGHYDHWALNVDHPRLLVALVIMLDQFPRNIYRDTSQMYDCDARCLSLVKRGLRVGVSERLRPIERVFLCLALTHSESMEDQALCMEEWRRAMDELAADDPLNAFHEIFHRHVAVIQRFGRFPHRNKILQRANTAAEEEFLGDSSFRFDLPLVRQPDGKLVFAGAVKRRTVKVLGHEYETLLPDVDEAPDGAFEFKYEGPEGAFIKTQEQLRKQGYIRIGDDVPDFTAETSQGPSTSMSSSGFLVCAVLASGGLHAGVHHRVRDHGQAPARVEQARHQGHWSQRRRHRGSRALDRGHQRDAADAGELPDHRGQGSPGVDALRHARLDQLPPRVRPGPDHDGAQRVHHLAVEAGRVDPLLPGLRWPQLQ